ncbi:uncharacterized protein LOC101849000 [Aplysia californica]|uniref:Uncharacterized protein LOC101849000 n=1 Tax=Aplysia californica TaxID=6500 RepID=A0ABM0K3U2_APLCA|nr:uncharacterized protein LOC101849000 [Aplysia californica]
MNGRSALDRMKTKNFSMILVLIIVSSVSVWFLSYPSSPSIQGIVSKTQSGLRRLPANMKVEDKGLTVDPMYLQRLGLAPSSSIGRLSGALLPGKSSSSGLPAAPSGLDSSADQVLPSPKMTSGLPVIASGARPDHFEEAAVLMRSVYNLLPNYKLVVYDLDLSSSELVLLKKYCNTTWNCEIRKLLFEKYPSHLKYLDIRSYRPVCIQEMLNTYGAVVWVDDGFYFTEGNLTLSLDRARASGIQGWPIKYPTSSFTHQKMFQFFNTDQKHYYFQHLIESSHLILYNTERLAQRVMLPWVKCALLEECINPPGAQNSGCNYARRPYFLYSGCHGYDMSALNVLLGMAFSMEESSYTATQGLFGSLREDKLRAENKTQLSYEVGIGVGLNMKM